MRIVVDIPDEHVFRWPDLFPLVNAKNLDTFLISAIGIGVQTLSSAQKIMTQGDDKVVQFKSDHYWKNPIDK